MTVLIVDDAAFMRMMLKSMLEPLGHTVIGEAVNGEEGYEKYKTLKPDVVTMDITMPVLDGLGSLRKIREYDKDANVLMCSAMGQQTMVIEALQLGAKDFIVKPFQGDRVALALNRLKK